MKQFVPNESLRDDVLVSYVVAAREASFESQYCKKVLSAGRKTYQVLWVVEQAVGFVEAVGVFLLYVFLKCILLLLHERTKGLRSLRWRRRSHQIHSSFPFCK